MVLSARGYSLPVSLERAPHDAFTNRQTSSHEYFHIYTFIRLIHKEKENRTVSRTQSASLPVFRQSKKPCPIYTHKHTSNTRTQKYNIRPTTRFGSNSKTTPLHEELPGNAFGRTSRSLYLRQTTFSLFHYFHRSMCVYEL